MEAQYLKVAKYCVDQALMLEIYHKENEVPLRRKQAIRGFYFRSMRLIGLISEQKNLRGGYYTTWDFEFHEDNTHIIQFEIKALLKELDQLSLIK